MTEDSLDPSGPETSADIIERSVRTLTTGMIIAGAIVGLALYARPAPPRFDAFAIGEKIVRVDMKTGTIIACETGKTCERVLQHGQRLVVPHRTPALPKPATPPPAAPAAGK
jgi:hypothetical protein